MPYIIFGMAATVVIFPFMALCYLWNALAGLIVTMLVVLVIMNIYRSPAVALMPDVTPKPLRSSANGLVNLVGYFGPIVITVVNMVPFLTFGRDETSPIKVLVPVLVVLVSLIIAMVVLILKINEPKILEEMEEDLKLGEELSETIEKVEDNKKLSKLDLRNMWILLVAVCLWYMSFNAFETFNSTYSTNYYSTYEECVLTDAEFNENESKKDSDETKITYYIQVSDGEYEKVYEYVEGETYYVIQGKAGSSIASTGTIILTVSSVITFAVAGFFAVKFGRKTCVLSGVGLLLVGCLLIYLLGTGKPSAIIYLYFVLLGIGWALINVNSYPMMVEMSSSGNIGKYTGY
jgi:MFS family permease